MRFDLRLVLVCLLAIVLSAAGCTRARVSGTSEIPPLSVISASAAVAEAPESETGSLPAAQGSTAVALDPSSAAVSVGETVVMNIRVQDVNNLFGADVRLKYDSAVIEVVDANTLVPGIQISSGDFPDTSGGRGFVAQNTVNPSEGTIGYAMTLLSPAQPVSGSGTLASITFRGKASGSSNVGFTSVLLSDANANQIPTTKSDGTISVGGGLAPTETPKPAPIKTPTPGPPPPPSPSRCVYTVKAGDTLFSIARQFGTTVSDIAQANGITNVNQIFAGQKLVIPNCEPGPEPPPGECFTYVVKPGDTLYSLARRFGTTVSDIALRNNIVNPSLIFVGQKLTICPKGAIPPAPQPPAQCMFYTVQRGDTLFSVALRYDSTVQAIAQANNIANPNLIFVGQKLCIPN
ncbi:MAG: LysM peptidoglycan-binding domain-containing protein [Anaerolineae bacterium]